MSRERLQEFLSPFILDFEDRLEKCLDRAEQ